MSGAEFIAVSGVISSIIAIADGIKQVVDAASQAQGLPKAFRQASNQLPLVGDILEATVRNFGQDNVTDIEKSVALVIDSCQDKWTILDDLFNKVIPKENATRVERYFMAVKTLGKGGKVERLMKGILEDIQLLATIKTMTTEGREKDIVTTTPAEKERVAKAIIIYVLTPSASKIGRLREIPKREKANHVKSTLNPIIERKFGRYPDNKGKETLARAVSILENSGLGNEYVYRLSRVSFDPHKTIAEAIRRSSAEVVWALLYCLPQIKKKWIAKRYMSTAVASFNATYRHFPDKINMYYRDDGHSLLELAYREIRAEKDMENSTLILLMLVAYEGDGPGINHLAYLRDLFNSPEEKKRFEELKMCLHRAKKGLLVSMKPAEREEMVLSQFQSIWRVRDQARQEQARQEQARREQARQQERKTEERIKQSKPDQYMDEKLINIVRRSVYTPAMRTTGWQTYT